MSLDQMHEAARYGRLSNRLRRIPVAWWSLYVQVRDGLWILTRRAGR